MFGVLERGDVDVVAPERPQCTSLDDSAMHLRPVRAGVMAEGIMDHPALTDLPSPEHRMGGPTVFGAHQRLDVAEVKKPVDLVLYLEAVRLPADDRVAISMDLHCDD